MEVPGLRVIPVVFAVFQANDPLVEIVQVPEPIFKTLVLEMFELKAHTLTSKFDALKVPC